VLVGDQNRGAMIAPQAQGKRGAWRTRVARAAYAASLMALLAGCGESDREGGCTAACQPIVSFHYAEPRPGSEFRIELSPPGHVVVCTLEASGGATCQPNTGVMRLSFVAAGLDRITWVAPPDGPLRVRVTIDGVVISSQTFAHHAVEAGDPCAGKCSEDPNFELE
jgi:hypothetical protein